MITLMCAISNIRTGFILHSVSEGEIEDA